MLLPNAGLICVGGSGTLSLTTTALLVSSFTAVADGFLDEVSLQECQADLANNRLLLGTPGLYLVKGQIVCTSDTAGDLILQARKNAATVLNGCKGKQRLATAGRFSLTFEGLVKLTTTDNPKTIAASGDTGSFTGPARQPKMMCPIDMVASVVSSTAVITVEEAVLMAIRVG